VGSMRPFTEGNGGRAIGLDRNRGLPCA